MSLRCLKTSRITPVHLACIRADATILNSILSALRTDSISTIINLPTKTDRYENRQNNISFEFCISLSSFTPLHLAAMNKNGSECLKILLHYDNVNIDAKDKSHRTAIMYAILNGIDSNIIGKILKTNKYSNEKKTNLITLFRCTHFEMSTF